MFRLILIIALPDVIISECCYKKKVSFILNNPDKTCESYGASEIENVESWNGPITFRDGLTDDEKDRIWKCSIKENLVLGVR